MIALAFTASIQSLVSITMLRGFVLFAILFFALGSAAAQVTDTWFDGTVAEWDRVLDDTTAYLEDRDYQRQRTGEYETILARTKVVAESVRSIAETELAQVRERLNALGPPPAEGELPEAERIAERRSRYSARIVRLRAHVSEANLTLVRIEQLNQRLAGLSRSLIERELTKDWPIPILPQVMLKGAIDFYSILKTIIHIPVKWYASLSEDERSHGLSNLWAFAAVFIIAAVARTLRVVLLRRFGPDPALENPSYARRFFAAVADGMAKGLIPAVIIVGTLIWINRHHALISGTFLVLLNNFLFSTLIFCLAYTLPRAVLAPDLPAWQLTNIANANARKICNRITLLAAVFSIQFFLSWTSAHMAHAGEVNFSLELESVYFNSVTILQMVLLISLTPDRLWVNEIKTTDSATEKSTESQHGGWWLLRRLVRLAAIAAMISGLVGYAGIGFYVSERLVFSVLVGGGLFLLSGLFKDAVGLAARTGFARQRLGITREMSQTATFWITAAIYLILSIIGALLLAPIWGVSWKEQNRWLLETLQGFKIGDVTISPIAITLSIFTLLTMLAITRIVQRRLLEYVLPRTRMTLSAQYTVASVISYIGFAIAFGLAIAVLGIDLTNLAIVLGALSVGIGFGLQNVVNNFISGLILLVERPVKVGDWVIVAGLEGLVKRINIRSTEIETWQRASVIVPNAEILSNPVTNLTFRDNYGRIEVAVGVAYGSDTDQVRTLLLECARAHDRIARYPAPVVVFSEFGDSSLNFELRCFTDNVMNRLSIASDLRFIIDRRFREEGIDIPFPQRVVHLAPTNNATEHSSPPFAENAPSAVETPIVPADTDQPQRASLDESPKTLRPIV